MTTDREPPERVDSTIIVREEGVLADEAVAMRVHNLADRIEGDPVTSWTADDVYSALVRLTEVAESKRRDVEVVRGGRPPAAS